MLQVLSLYLGALEGLGGGWGVLPASVPAQTQEQPTVSFIPLGRAWATTAWEGGGCLNN